MRLGGYRSHSGGQRSSRSSNRMRKVGATHATERRKTVRYSFITFPFQADNENKGISDLRN